MPKGDRRILKADPEDGTTPVANLLLEAVSIAKLTGKEKGAILYLWRRTYGWEDKKTGARLKSRTISLNEWKKVLQSDEQNASKVIKNLVKQNIFKREFLGPGKGYVYAMNTNIASWNSNCINQQGLKDLISLVEIDKGGKKIPATLVKNDNPPLSNFTTPSDTLKKDIKKDIKKGMGPYLEILKSIKKYPFNQETDIQHLENLKSDFPTIDLLKVVKALRDYCLDHLITSKSNPRLRLRHFCELEQKWQSKPECVKAKPKSMLPTTQELKESLKK